jgi:hypothetical protein
MIWKARGKRFYKGEILWVWRKAKSFKTETRPSLVAATLKADSFKTDRPHFCYILKIDFLPKAGDRERTRNFEDRSCIADGTRGYTK